MEPTFRICSQCGFSHPPILDGSKCPMAKEKSPEGESIDYNNFFRALQNILTSQIKNKNIKDTKKFLGTILVEITKQIGEYTE